MNRKGLEAEITFDKTLNHLGSENKFSKLDKNKTQVVDINVLKARVQETQNRENKKNITILIFFLILLTVLGVFLT